MGGVRLLATVFLLLGWVLLIAGLIEAVVIYNSLNQLLRGVLGPSAAGTASLGAALGAFIVASLPSLLPFFGWGVLSALMELQPVSRNLGASPRQVPAPTPGRGQRRSRRLDLESTFESAAGWRLVDGKATIFATPMIDNQIVSTVSTTEGLRVGDSIDAGHAGWFYEILTANGQRGYVATAELLEPSEGLEKSDVNVQGVREGTSAVTAADYTEAGESVEVTTADLTSDGKILCPSCGRANPRRAGACRSCGAEFVWRGT